jgi:P27 family predicted phage terminase small subunit
MSRKTKKQTTAMGVARLSDRSIDQAVTRRRRSAADLPPLKAKDCPSHLDAVAKTRWRQLAKELTDADMLAQIDRDALMLYCSTWSRYVAAAAKVQDLGLVVSSPAGVPIQNPFLSVLNVAMSQLVVLAKQLGLTPAARGDLRRRG